MSFSSALFQTESVPFTGRRGGLFLPRACKGLIGHTRSISDSGLDEASGWFSQPQPKSVGMEGRRFRIVPFPFESPLTIRRTSSNRRLPRRELGRAISALLAITDRSLAQGGSNDLLARYNFTLVISLAFDAECPVPAAAATRDAALL